MITFPAGELADPARGLPIAMYTALPVTSALYVLRSIGVFRALPVADL